MTDPNTLLENIKARLLEQRGRMKPGHRCLFPIDRHALLSYEPKDPRQTPVGDAIAILLHAFNGVPISDYKGPVERLKEWTEATPAMEWWADVPGGRLAVCVHYSREHAAPVPCPACGRLPDEMSPQEYTHRLSEDRPDRPIHICPTCKKPL